MMSDYETIILCAIRYALGRRTYIVSLVCGYVASQIDTLSAECLSLIVRDIKNQEPWGYGDECDKRDWVDLLSKINQCGRDIRGFD